MSDFGVVTAARTVRLQRTLKAPVDRVWAYLTESEPRRFWLAAGPMELKVGGKVELTFVNSELSTEPTPQRFADSEGHKMVGEVTACDPPRLLAYTWSKGYGEVRFELEDLGDETRLTVTHSDLSERAGMVSVASGWHTHLDLLTDLMEGREPRGFWSNFVAAEAEYERRIPAAT